MNCIKGLKVGALALTMGIIAVLGLALNGCSGGGGGGVILGGGKGSMKLSGTIASSGSYTFGKGTYGKSFAPAPPTTPIDKVVAIPMDRGELDARNMPSSVSGTIGADGTFDLTLPKDKDWLLVLINSARRAG